MTFEAIGQALGTDGKHAKRAVRWALGPDAKDAPELARPKARYKQIAGEALSLREEGWTLQRIADRFELSVPMVHRTLAWARKQRRKGGAR